MQDTDALLARLADIEMPQSPEWTWLWLVLLLLLALAVALFWWWRRPRPEGKTTTAPSLDACAELDRLQAQWLAGQLADRETAFRLATILRLGLALPQLTPRCPAPLRHEEDAWRKTVMLLQRARYRKTSEAIEPEVFERARHWLSTQPDEPPC